MLACDKFLFISDDPKLIMDDFPIYEGTGLMRVSLINKASSHLSKTQWSDYLNKVLP